jgi:hypothetical protein
MKKLFTLLFTAALAFSLAMPVFAQDSGSQESSTKTKKTKKTKASKEKKTKASDTSKMSQ